MSSVKKPADNQRLRDERARTLQRDGAAASDAAASPIADLPNLGPKSAQMLNACGISSAERLRELGAVRAYAMVKQAHESASLNLLWALEGALTGLPWQEVAREHRLSLLLCLEQLQNGD